MSVSSWQTLWWAGRDDRNEWSRSTEYAFHSGDLVVITDGPFVGIEAIYQTADAERRAFILMETLLARPVSWHIESGRLRKASQSWFPLFGFAIADDSPHHHRRTDVSNCRTPS